MAKRQREDIVSARIAWLVSLQRAGWSPSEIQGIMSTSDRPPEGAVPVKTGATDDFIPLKTRPCTPPRVQREGSQAPRSPETKRAPGEPPKNKGRRDPEVYERETERLRGMALSGMSGKECAEAFGMRFPALCKWASRAGIRFDSKPKRYDIGALLKACSGMGVELLDREWRGIRAQYRCRCGRGHEWTPRAAHLIDGKSHCPECTVERRTGAGGKYNMEALRKSAEEQGVELLTEEWTGCASEYPCRCPEGHEWTPRAIHLIQGKSHCPSCSYERRRKPPRPEPPKVERERCPFCGSSAFKNGKNGGRQRHKCSNGAREESGGMVCGKSFFAQTSEEDDDSALFILETRLSVVIDEMCAIKAEIAKLRSLRRKR